MNDTTLEQRLQRLDKPSTVGCNAAGSQRDAHNSDVVKLLEPKRGGGPLLYHMFPAGAE